MLSGLLLAITSTFIVAQTSPDKRQVVAKRQIFLLLAHEWMELPSHITGTTGGGAFVCVAISQQGAYHLERKIPSAISPTSYDEGVYEGTISDADLKTLLALVDDADVKSFVGSPPQHSWDTWQFVIGRPNGFQSIEISGRDKTSKGLEALKKFLKQLDKHKTQPLKEAPHSDCNPAKLAIFQQKR